MVGSPPHDLPRNNPCILPAFRNSDAMHRSQGIAIHLRAALAAAFTVSLAIAQPSALCGIDVLVRTRFELVEGAKIGLITNHTGLTLEGESIVDVFARQKNLTLVALFSPEHGFAGTLDQAKIADSMHQGTGLKIHSLYGKTRKPTKEMLEGVDTIVFDIQDIGCRFYTYVSTMKLAMEAAAEHGLRFVVLDRPNPIGGTRVLGPVLDAGTESFVGYHTIAVQHGMTVGELANMLAKERKIGIVPQVVRVEQWKRAQLWDETGLRWVNPSPNMRNLNQALLYPGVGLLETTNVSVGRGTDTPFEILGAPWIDARAFAATLNEQRVPGVRFVPVSFRPTSSKYRDELCQGVQILITDRAKLAPLRAGMTLAWALRALHRTDWKPDRYGRLLCDGAVLKAVLDGKTPSQIERLWRNELAEFERRRAGFLLYD